MALNGRLTSTMSNRALSVQKFSDVPNVSRREIQRHGITGTGPTPENGSGSWSFDISICSFLKAAKLIRFSAAPPSIRMWYIMMLMMVRGRRAGATWPLPYCWGSQRRQSWSTSPSTYGVALPLGQVRPPPPLDVDS
jgi:hypothetical protein